METERPVSHDPQAEINALKEGIREITHEVNNPLGVLRMALYMIESATLTDEKKAHYLRAINESIEKIDAGLKRYKDLRNDPISYAAKMQFLKNEES